MVDPLQREELRKKSVKLSKLYKTITESHVSKNQTSETGAEMRSKIDDYRVGEHKRSQEWYRYSDSLAAQLVHSAFAIELIGGTSPAALTLG